MTTYSKNTAKAVLNRMLLDRNLTKGFIAQEGFDSWFISLIPIEDKPCLEIAVLDTAEKEITH